LIGFRSADPTSGFSGGQARGLATWLEQLQAREPQEPSIERDDRRIGRDAERGDPGVRNVMASQAQGLHELAEDRPGASVA
jgi:hypothetical protein